jgi:hypothetical protein
MCVRNRLDCASGRTIIARRYTYRRDRPDDPVDRGSSQSTVEGGYIDDYITATPRFPAIAGRAATRAMTEETNVPGGY